MKSRFEDYPQVVEVWTRAGFQLSVRNYREAVDNCRIASKAVVQE